MADLRYGGPSLWRAGTPGERPLLETNGDMWTQQRSSGVLSERKNPHGLEITFMHSKDADVNVPLKFTDVLVLMWCITTQSSICVDSNDP